MTSGGTDQKTWATTIIVVAAVLAYHNSFSGPFIFDDVSAIARNSAIRQWSTALSPAQGGLTTSGRPLLSLSFALNWAFGGSRVLGYHVVNLVIHGLAGLTLFGVVRRTLRLPRWRERYDSAAESLALVTAVMWTVHPLLTESVTYVVQRAESLAGLCYLATTYGFVRGVEASGSKRWAVVSVVACFAGMAAKEVTVTAPLMVLLFDRTFVAGNFKEAWHLRSKYYYGLMSSWLLLAGLLVGAGTRGGTMALGVGGMWWAYPLTQFESVVHYIWLSLWPNPLVLDYGTRLVAHMSEILTDTIIVFSLVTATLWALWRRPVAGFLGAWFFVILAPTSLAPGTIQMTVEHRMYLALIAFIAGSVLAFHHWLGRRSMPLFGALACAALMLTVHRNEDFRSAIAIWSDTVAKRPANALAQTNLGALLQEAGRTTEAVAHYEMALRIEPNSPEAHNDFGVALRDSGKTAEAIVELEQALRLRPDYAEAHNNLGVALRQLGRNEEAIAQYHEALRLKSGYAEAHNNLGSALQNSGRLAEGMTEFERALQLDPDFAEAHSNLAVALRRSGEPEKAVGHFETALHLKPDYAEVHFNLALLLRELGRTREAKVHYDAARRLKPDVPEIPFGDPGAK